MPPKKAPLAERDVNVKSKEPSNTKQKSHDLIPQVAYDSPSLADVANKITKTHSKKRSREDDDTENNSPNNAASDPKHAAKKAKKTTTSNGKKDDSDKFDVKDITLPKEEDKSVPIYDTCDDLRTKIRAHLRQPGQTQASLARGMSQTYDIAGESEHKIRGEQIRKFLDKKGPTAGATSSVYYAGYVYFEKLRLKQKKPKSKKRQEMEQVHGPDGARTDVDDRQPLTLSMNETASQDKYGKLNISQLPPGASATRPRSKRLY